MADPSFEWDAIKDIANHAKHGVTFVTAQRAFTDPFRVITKDVGLAFKNNAISVWAKWRATS